MSLLTIGDQFPAYQLTALIGGDLSKVDAIGFIDLMPGSGHGPGGWSDVAQFEIYGKAVSRDR